MYSRRIVFAVLAASLVVPAAPAAAAPAKARLVACGTAVAQPERFATFEGELRTLPGASRLQVRFTLEARTPDRSRWSKIAAPGFGAWIASSPGVSRFVYTKRVENLFAPARYRIRARFRWLDAAGAVIAREQRRSPVCRQPDQRANLVPLRLDARRGSSPGSRSYVIPVVNRGHVDAAGFALRLTVNGEPQPVAMVSRLAAGDRTLLAVEGPACRPGTSVVAVVDHEGAIDEADETDNTIAVACPAGA